MKVIRPLFGSYKIYRAFELLYRYQTAKLKPLAPSLSLSHQIKPSYIYCIRLSLRACLTVLLMSLVLCPLYPSLLICEYSYPVL